MFVDDEGELFNPFSIGPPASNQRFDYKMPRGTTYPQPEFAKIPSHEIDTAPSYPAPVYATWPPPKEHTNRSVSQVSLNNDNADVRSHKSHRGEIAISKAINEEMAAAKKRIIAGGKSKTTLPEAESAGKSVTTLLSIRKPRSSSQSSTKTVMSSASRAASRKSVHSQLSSNKSQGNQAVEKVSSAMNNRSNIELKQLKGSTNITEIKDSNAPAPDSVSRTSGRADAGKDHEKEIDRISIRSKASAQQADNISRVSVKSKASDYGADNITRISVKSKASAQQVDNISRVSLRSKASDHGADNISRKSIKSKASVQQADNISRVSLRSKVSDHGADNISRKSVKSRASVNQENNLSQVSMQAHAGDNVSRIEGSKAGELARADDRSKSLKERAEYVKKELEKSMQTTRSLAEKAAELSDRLKAGNEFKYNRFESLFRQYTNTEPLKRFREDRMSFWFKDALLS